MWITTTRSCWIAQDFILVVLKSCEDQPIFLVDQASWHKSAFKSLGLSYLHVTFGLKDSIERWFRTVKERTKRFWNNFRGRDWRRVHRLTVSFFWSQGKSVSLRRLSVRILGGILAVNLNRLYNFTDGRN